MTWLLTIVACTWFEPQLPPLRTSPRVVEAHDFREIPTDAVLPSDLTSSVDGEFTVLDSFEGRLSTFDTSGTLTTHRQEPGLTSTLRAAETADGEGHWLVVPAADGLVRLDASGIATQGNPLGMPAPISVLDLGTELVVGTRYGRLAWVDAASGSRRLVHDRGADGEPLGVIGDLTQLSDGTVVAIDTQRARVHLATASGRWLSWFGYYGIWIGYLSKPKAVLDGPDDTLLIADSGVGGVQLFERDGTPLGAIASDGVPLAVPHTIALAHGSEPDQILALDPISGTVWSFVLDVAAVTEARAGASVRHLRSTIAPATSESDLCLQCHDGVMRDGRFVWAGGLAHPLAVDAPDAPDTLPLGDDGIVCTTCHSPHPSASGDADTFLRMRKADLCVACHAVEPHGPEGSAHPVDVDGSCLGCHAVHGAEREPLLRSASSWTACAECHDDHHTELDHPVGRTVGLSSTGLPTVSGEQGCTSCHDLVGGTGASLIRADLSCTGCHPKVSAPHDRIRGAHGQSCLGCHDVHGAATAPLLGSAVAQRRCLACHPAPSDGHPIPSSGCTDCHDAHTPRPASPCGSCHQDHPLDDDAPHGGLDCVACHPAHDRVATGGSPTLNPRARRCLACHDPSARGLAPRITAWRHPDAVFTPEGARWTPVGGLPLFDADGVQVPPTSNGELVCESCHDVHGGDDGLREGWKQACSACHGAEALILYRWYHQPDRRESP